MVLGLTRVFAGFLAVCSENKETVRASSWISGSVGQFWQLFNLRRELAGEVTQQYIGVTTSNVKKCTFRSLRKPIAFLKPIAIRFCSLNYWAFDRFEDRCINLPLLRQAGFLSIWVISGPSDCNGFRLCQLEREVH